MNEKTQRIDGARLQQAMENIAADQLAQELREAIVYGPPVLAKVFSEYQRLTDADGSLDEPVSWRNAAIRVGEDLCSVGPHGYYDMTAEQWLNWALGVVTVHLPQPKREPLTDEQLFQLWDEDTSCDMPDTLKQFKHTARAIEAAHGIQEEK